MEVDNIQTQHSKFSKLEKSKIGQYPDENQGKELKISNLGAGSGANLVGGGDSNRLRGWHNSSRIIRVSRASGGKDRHSKVWTSKGLRDRRVRLSVTTAIQFYDLQDRLGYDQPSKAVEWLIKAAADSINELPSLDGSFPETPKQLSDEKRVSDGVDQGFDSADVELEDQDPNFDPNPNQHFSLSKSACSSTSDTSKGSGLSLSRSDVRVNRVKARERARERTAKEKEKEGSGNHQNLNPISPNSSFTELLTSGINNMNSNSSSNHHHQNAGPARQWPLTPMDYFGFPSQISIPPAMAMSMSINPPFGFSGESNQPEQMQHFPFLSDHLMPVGATSQGPNGDCNLNFTISSGLAGFNRGTLQSNSPSPNSQFPFMNSSNAPFFIGAMENHSHQFPPGLHLYGDGSSKHSDHKGKGKN